MNPYHSYRDLIEKELVAGLGLDRRNPFELYEPVRYILSLGGKRIRPLLVLISCDLFDSPVEKAIPASLAIEVFHNFSLVHDDIMDKAPYRRGLPTVHEKWGNAAGILSGDAMLVLAYELLSKSDPAHLGSLLKTFNEVALQVCEGQQLDMMYERHSKVNVLAYMKMIRLKTAVLLGSAMKMGAIAANAREEDTELIYKFAVNMGIAFQLQDDILDIYGDPEKFGKRRGGDIVSNKKTFLLLKALELSHHYMQEELHGWLNAPDFSEDEKVKAVTGIYDFLNVKGLAEKEMWKHFEIAKNHLSEIPANEGKKQELLDFASSLMSRES